MTQRSARAHRVDAHYPLLRRLTEPLRQHRVLLGLQSRGHPPYVTPLYSYVEMAEQLRHRAGERQVEDAAIGMVSSELGNYNAALIHVLERAA